MAQQVRQSQGSHGAAEQLEEPHPVRQVPHPLGLLGAQAGGQEVLYLPGLVQQDEGPVAGAGQRPGAVQDPLQNGVEVQALVDAQAGLAQPGQPVSEVLSLKVTGILPVHLHSFFRAREGRHSSHRRNADLPLTAHTYRRQRNIYTNVTENYHKAHGILIPVW